MERALLVSCSPSGKSFKRLSARRKVWRGTSSTFSARPILLRTEKEGTKSSGMQSLRLLGSGLNETKNATCMRSCGLFLSRHAKLLRDSRRTSRCAHGKRSHAWTISGLADGIRHAIYSSSACELCPVALYFGYPRSKLRCARSGS